MIKNKKGFTLVELMIVLALLGVVIMIGFSVFSFGFKSFNAQADNIDNQSKVQHAISDISKEIRKVDAVDKIVVDKTAVGKIDIGGVVYEFKGTTLLKNGNNFVSGIKSFKPLRVENKVTIEITSLANRGREFTLVSEVYVRE